MMETTKLPLGTNLNKNNILSPPETQHDPISNIFDRDFPFQESSSVTKMLANFEDSNLNDENILPDEPPLGHNKKLETSIEMAGLKAELEATRRRLAEYEMRSDDVPQTSSPLKYNTSNKHNLSSNYPPLDFGHKDILPWSDYDSSILEVPTPPSPHPVPFDFPAHVPPLRLPSTAAPFNANTPARINSSMLYLKGLLIIDNFVLREEHRNFSLPIPAPIGEPRRILPIQRAFSAEIKRPRDKEPWRVESDWSPPWSGIPIGTSARQLSATPNHSVIFNDQQPWPDVLSSILPR